MNFLNWKNGAMMLFFSFASLAQAASFVVELPEDRFDRCILSIAEKAALGDYYQRTYFESSPAHKIYRLYGENRFGTKLLIEISTLKMDAYDASKNLTLTAETLRAEKVCGSIVNYRNKY